MKQVLFVIPLLLALAGCSQDGGFGSSKSASESSSQPASPPTIAKAGWQAVLVPGGTDPDAIFKVNMLTGAALVHRAGSANTAYTAIKDGTQLPLGDYHLLTWSQLNSDGGFRYNVYRFDNATGHTWVYVEASNGAAAYWGDINAAQ